jgi:hypothetical protein
LEFICVPVKIQFYFKLINTMDDIEEVNIKRFRMDEIELNAKIAIIGKPGCWAPGTCVLMHDGHTKAVEEVKVGDKIMGDDSTPRTVQELCHNFDQMYKINMCKGDSIVVNKQHVLVLVCTGYNQHLKGEIVEITVEEYLNRSKTWRKRHKWFRSGCTFQHKPVDVDPYLLGLWLGDGHSAGSTISTADVEIVDYLKQYVELKGLRLKTVARDKKDEYDLTYSIRSKLNSKDRNTFLDFLRKNNLLQNKHVPFDYKVNSRDKQLKLLAGFIDTDGSYDIKGNCFDVVQKNESLLDDMIFVARSLGFSAFKKKCFKRCTNSPDPNHIGTYYRCNIYGSGIEDIPTILNRKMARRRPEVFKNHLVTGFTIESVGYGEYFGFTLDGNKRLLMADMSVNHNTGKTSIIKDILFRHKKKFTKGILMSGTTDSSKDFDGVFPDIFIYNKYKQDVADKFWGKQKRIVRKRGKGDRRNMSCFVIDDCMHDKKWVSSETIADIFMNGRHYDLLFIVAMQYCMGLSPSLRSCVDYIFILRENSFSNKKRLFEHYCSIFPDFKTFCKVLDALTVNYQCIVVKQRKNLSTRIEDNIFWYKAELHPSFRIGIPAIWEYHDRRYNRNYEDDNDNDDNDGLMKNHRAVIKDKGKKRGKGTLVINMRD